MAQTAAERKRAQRARGGKELASIENTARTQRARKARHDPANTAYVFVDGETSDDTHYDYFACTILYQGVWYEKRLYHPGTHINLLDVMPFLDAVRRFCRRELGAKSVEFIAFSFSYDADQLIGHLPASVADATKYDLSRQCTGTWGAKRPPGWQRDIRVGNYAVYLGKKTWEFSRIITKEDGSEIAIRPLRVHDFFTLNASSFLHCVVATCETELAKLPEQQQSIVAVAIATVKKGKEARGTFAEHGMTPEAVHEYNKAEGILATFYVQNYYALCASLGLYPRSPAGPAPLARAAMKANGAHKHVKPECWDTLEFHSDNGTYQKINMSFFGGRIETLGQGIVPDLYEYDINSAYPSEQVKLPCLAHGTFMHITDPVAVAQLCAERYPWAIYNIDYTSAPESEIGPFPVRTRVEGVCFPLNGRRVWATAPEVYAFDDLVRERPGATLQGGEAVIWLPDCDNEQPFAYLAAFYEERRALKQAGDPRQLPLKLASNSTYGILAQRAGNYQVVDEAGQILEIHTSNTANLFGAALVTGAIRARLYAVAIRAAPRTIVQFATDAIKATKPLDIPLSDALGGWSHEVHHDVAIIQPGLTLDAAGECVKTRGISRAAFKVRYDEICDAWRRGEESISVTVRTYRTLRDCLHRHPLTGEYCWSDGPWGVFVDVPHQLNIAPSAIKSKRDVAHARPGVAWQYLPPYVSITQGTRSSQIQRNLNEELSMPPELIARAQP